MKQKTLMVPSNPHISMDELALSVSSAAATVKTYCSVGNNAPWAACITAMNHIRRHPAYRHHVKAAYRKAFAAFLKHERTLIYASQNRFFHVGDMAESTRKYYSNITDADYYNFWASFGYSAFCDTKPFFTALVNKVKLIYDRHGVPHSESLAWSYAAHAALVVGVNIFNAAVEGCLDKYPNVPLTKEKWLRLFADFNLSDVVSLWQKAHAELDRASAPEFPLTADEARNIQMSIDQLYEIWTLNDRLLSSRMQVSEDNADLFRTRGELMKVQRIFTGMRQSEVGD